ncbi:MAG TPA: hypothetical protein DCP63_13740, partial [Bacteroidetes bacterium]|nr:hypothetical protein [Bacteroidota bacterium]
MITTVSDFETAYKKYGGALDKLQRVGSMIDLEKYDIRKRGPKEGGPIFESELEGTMAQLTEEVLLRAAKLGASDIHVEPGEREMMIRFRVDG